MKFIQAKHYRPGRIKPIRLLVLHSMEAPEKGTTAESVAAYFARGERVASAHYCLDSDSVVQCVKDTDTAYAAMGGNADGLHFELSGYARQSTSEWLDPFGVAMLDRAAALLHAKASAYGIPLVKLTVAQVRDGHTKGVCDHATITAAFPPGSGHTDPGPSFPWSHFMTLLLSQAVPPPAQRSHPGKSVIERIHNTSEDTVTYVWNTVSKRVWEVDRSTMTYRHVDANVLDWAPDAIVKKVTTDQWQKELRAA